MQLCTVEDESRSGIPSPDPVSASEPPPTGHEIGPHSGAFRSDQGRRPRPGTFGTTPPCFCCCIWCRPGVCTVHTAQPLFIAGQPGHRRPFYGVYLYTPSPHVGPFWL